jgi:predicted nucleotidyltransferase/predicted transcriptional regulator
MKIRKVNLEANEAYLKVIRWFFSFPERKIGLNDLIKEVNISKTTANRIINLLEKEGFLIKEIIGKAWRVNCNQKHKYNRTKKVCYNLEMIYKSVILKEIDKKYRPKAIILFGSYRKGDDNEKSDIDIAVESITNEKFKIEKFATIERFGFRKNVNINIHVFSRKKINNNLFSNIANGVVLDGFLEVKK